MPAKATTPATTAAPTARRRKYSTIASSSSAAGVPHEVDGGQEGADADGQHAAEDRGGVDPAVHGSPAFPPAGTRPDAMAPAIAPKQYGTITDEMANSGAEGPPVARAEHRLAEREARAPQHDAERGDRRAGTKSVSVIEA